MEDFGNFEDFGDLAEVLKNIDRSQLMDQLMENLDFDSEEMSSGSLEMLQMLQTRMSAEAALKQEQWETAESLLELLIRQCDALPNFRAMNWTVKPQLANVKAMLGKNEEAMPLYLEVMALASDPKLQERLREEMGQLASINEEFFPLVKSMWEEGIDRAVVSAYYGFVALATMGGEISEKLLETLETAIHDGLHFSETIGHPEWGYPLHHLRSSILLSKGRLQESLDEAVVALSLRQKDVSFLSDAGMNHPTMFLGTVGVCLGALQRYEEAIPYLEQVVNSADAPIVSLYLAYSGLSFAYSDQGKSDLAREMENKALELGQREEIQTTFVASTVKTLFKRENK